MLVGSFCSDAVQLQVLVSNNAHAMCVCRLKGEFFDKNGREGSVRIRKVVLAD